MGVCSFVTVFGYPPFHHDSDAVIIQLILQGFDPTVRPGYGAHFPQAMPVSAGVKDFIARLLEMDVAKRMTAEEALNHPWLKGASASATQLDVSVFSSLKTFINRPRLRAAILRVMVDSMLNEHDLRALQTMFTKLDADADGKITFNELHKALTDTIKSKWGTAHALLCS
jgi:serine/threonine protein kinase